MGQCPAVHRRVIFEVHKVVGVHVEPRSSTDSYFSTTAVVHLSVYL